MTTLRTRAAIVVAGLAIVVGLPMLGHWSRRGQPSRCAYDGLAIESIYRVEVIRSRDVAHEFCCVRCAQRWLEKPGTLAASATVIDEASGEQIDARDAWFVRSSVVTNRVNGNRIHVFRDRADAERHAQKFTGEILTGSERPFAIE
jgi:hypothetical protein